jgi:ATPase subunit of ABC transporter with duplicated ATPase domains
MGGTVADMMCLSKEWYAYNRITEGIGSDQDYACLEGKWDVEKRLESALARAGMMMSSLERSSEELSGGERIRLALASLEAGNHDYLLLDEPTNHLDESGREWFKQWVCKLNGALIATHDSSVLETLNNVLELTPLGITSFSGGWVEIERMMEQRDTAASHRIRVAEENLSRSKATNLAVVESSRSRRARGSRTAKTANQSKISLGRAKENSQTTATRMKRANLVKVTRCEEELQKLRAQHLDLASQCITVSQVPPSPSQVAKLEEVSIPYIEGAPFNLNVMPTDRLAVTGNNGTGKSSLLRLLAGQAKFQHGGNVTVTNSVGFVDQHFGLSFETISALEYFKRTSPNLKESDCRINLARLGMKGDSVLKPISNLSGGEQIKVALAAHLCGVFAPKLLLLDEPDNHIDAHTRKIIETALQEYKGALVVVSHDKAFRNAINLREEIRLDNGVSRIHL